MDKNDQHNNQVGDDFDNLSSQNNLPSIWDSISEELNAFDGEDSSMDVEEMDVDSDAQHLANVADFSVIKEGFDLNFKTNQPPKFMWDDIEQELESFTITDDVAAFSAIKSSFEETYKEKSLPNFTWDDLSEEMDNPTPKVEVEDYSFVKSGFEKKYNGVVLPLFEWNDLAERMDSEAILADTPDKFSIIKDSFVAEYKGKTPPASTWANINGQLDLQTTWGRFMYKLKNQTYQYWSKNAMLVGAIALLIGGGKSCLFDAPSLDVNNSPIAKNTVYTGPVNSGEIIHTFDYSKQNTLATTGGELETAKLLSEEETPIGKKKLEQKNKISEANPAFVATNDNKKSTDNKSINGASLENNLAATLVSIAGQESTTDNNTVDEIANGVKKEDAALAANSSNTNTSTTTNFPNVNRSPVNSSGILNSTINGSNDENKNVVVGDRNSLGAKSNSNLSIINNKEVITDIFSTNDEFNSYYPQQGILENSFALNNNSEKFLESLSKKNIEDVAIEDMEYNSFTIVRQRVKNKKLRFEVGLIGKAGSSLFLGKSILNGLNSSSLSTTEMRLTGSVGVMGNCFVSANDAIVVGVYPYSTAQQYFAQFTGDGYYSEQEMKLSYLDFTLGYQRTLVRYNNLRKVPSKLYARLDLGLGYLTKAESVVNNETTLETTDLYNRLNLSLGLSLGNSHEIKQFVFDYGITANVGMTNMMANNVQPAVEPAHLLNFGGYVGVRYVLFAKLPMKTKEFEWSPPFYIEEPVY